MYAFCVSNNIHLAAAVPCTLPGQTPTSLLQLPEHEGGKDGRTTGLGHWDENELRSALTMKYHCKAYQDL